MTKSAFPMPRSLVREKRNASITIRCTEELSDRLSNLLPDKSEKMSYLRDVLKAVVEHLEASERSKTG